MSTLSAFDVGAAAPTETTTDDALAEVYEYIIECGRRRREELRDEAEPERSN